jgi:hypothetical protein
MLNQEQYDAPEDVAGQAGWMFSDMLIALMVVFLATISFIPQSTLGSSSNLSKGTGDSQSLTGGGGSYTYIERFEQEFIYTYQADEVGNVTKDIATFLRNYKLPADSIIDSAQFVAGFSATERPQDAIERAIAFSKALETLSPGILSRAATVLNSSSQLSSDLVTVRLTFSARISTK